MLALMQTEWFKLRKSKISFIILAGPFIAFLGGLTVDFTEADAPGVEWYLILLATNLAYALLFLPLISGVLASTICRYEHQEGGWKQLLALPVTRGKVFLSKYLLLMAIVLVIQLLYLAALYSVGLIKGVTEPFPLTIIWKSVLGGWVATLPLVALQLWLSILFKSYAAPLTVNVVFTLPAVLAINSERFGPYYPWAQPFSMMYISGDPNDLFFVPWEQLLTVVGGSFVIFYLMGWVYFQRKAI
ncbi:ABC transporter permease [Jeotgalibacillus sp. ET6]|uniref:ABC transporter permease n=1 Tax=Jeotgalibacillus sp. ET6 TaxID=3037260 RepID=UPI0024183ECB|nr:ABC transporter permease [Jeotgalibacillus sp. ET6]MDG5472314.1 ABC transporter permease [Jeotgalibacillus sp. ET6]